MIKIFMIDDDEMHNYLNKMLLLSMGLTDVHFRTSGNEALKYLEEGREKESFPDLIFIDLNMPGMNGFTFIEKFEQLHMTNNPTSKIIVLTSSVLDNERQKALHYKCVMDFLSKPLTKNVISGLIQKAEALH
jgi:CheY-like chemotaxis protein